MEDQLLFHNKEYYILAYSKPWPLDVGSFGVEPVLDAVISANLKGYDSTYLLKDNRLYWYSLRFRAQTGNFPKINNVEAQLTGNDVVHFMTYEKIMLPVLYTGSIIIGADFVQAFSGQYYSYPHAFEDVWECTFDHGAAVSVKDYSAAMARFREKLKKEKLPRFLGLYRKPYSHAYQDKWEIYKKFKIF